MSQLAQIAEMLAPITRENETVIETVNRLLRAVIGACIEIEHDYEVPRSKMRALRQFTNRLTEFGRF